MSEYHSVLFHGSFGGKLRLKEIDLGDVNPHRVEP